MLNESKHTPGPWKLWEYTKPSKSDSGEVEFGIQTDYPEALCNGARSIAVITGGLYTRKYIGQMRNNRRAAMIATNRANAEFIVRAVNNHDALVKALQAAVERMEAVATKIPVENRHEGISQRAHVQHMAGHLAQHAKLARAALEAATK